MPSKQCYFLFGLGLFTIDFKHAACAFDFIFFSPVKRFHLIYWYPVNIYVDYLIW